MADPLACSNSSVQSASTDLSENSRNVIINDRWQILGKIGEGSFGEVFEAKDINDGTLYAIKRERKSMRHPQLQRESEYYRLLGNAPGVPQCHWYGEFDEFNCIVLDLLGPSLKDIRQSMTPMPFDIIIELVYQMIDIIQYVHQKGLVFRDIKPDNFLFGYQCKLPEVRMVKLERDKPHYQYEVPNARSVLETWGKANIKLHIIDLGLATPWRDSVTGKALPEAKPKRRNKIGTARYASIRVHRGRMHARGDDLEGIAYILLDMVLGTLPWTGIQAKNSAAGWDRMRVMKLDAEMADLLDDYPEGLVKFINYTRNLRFSDEPDYDLLKQYLKGSLPGGDYSTAARTPFERTHNSEPRQRHCLAADMIPLNGQSTQQRGLQQQVTDLPPPQDESSGSDPKSKKWTSREQRAGWYTYKHDEEPWKPEIDWDRNEGKQNATTASWGEDKANAAWGPKEEPGWPSSAARTDSGTGWDCQPSSQETKGGSWGTKPDTNNTWRTDTNNLRKVDASNSWKASTEQGWGSDPAKSVTWGAAKPGISGRSKENENTKGWGTEPSNANRGQVLASTNSRTGDSWGAKSDTNPGTTWGPMQNGMTPRSNPQPNHQNTRNEASGSAKWSAWAASNNAKTQNRSSSHTHTQRHPPSHQQAHKASEQQSWTTQADGGGWDATTDKDGWTTKTPRHDNRQSQGRGRRKEQQHW